MRTLGYALVLGGFLWLTYDVLAGFPSYNRVTTAATVAMAKKAWSNPAPLGYTIGSMWQIYYGQKPKYRLLLLPSGLMLGGGLMLRRQKNPKVFVSSPPPDPADIKGSRDQSTEAHSARNAKGVRMYGHLLLVIGFLWLAQSALSGLAGYQFRVTRRIVEGLVPLGDKVPLPVAFDAFSHLCSLLKFRYSLLLLPGCLMLVGAFMVAAQKAPLILVERDPPALPPSQTGNQTGR